MASKTAPKRSVRAIFLEHADTFFCSFWGALIDLFLTNFWTTFGCLFGCLLGAFSGLLRFSWKPLDPKTLKNGRFFKVFDNAAFWLFELLMALLGSSCPLFGRSGPKVGPKMVPKSGPKSDQKVGKK